MTTDPSRMGFPDESDDLIFAAEEETPPYQPDQMQWKVMIVDDEAEVHHVTQLTLSDFIFEGKGLSFINAYSGQEAQRFIADQPDIALILLDVVMETDDAGLQTVKYIRETLNNPAVRIVLRTGQPGQAPEARVIVDYDINDYKAKNELTRQKLLTTLIAALRAFRHVTTIESQRQENERLSLALMEHNRTLAQRVEERTAALAEVTRQAEEARAAAERASQAKTAFLANMSHELRTPLNAILGFTRIVRRRGQENLPAKQLENLDKVLISAEHLLALINTILDIAKIEAGRMEVLPVTFTAETLLEMCLITAQPLLKERVSLVKKLEADLPPIFSDSDKVKQILLNLLSNAAKFTQAGTITASARCQDDLLIIDIADTGIGISEEAMSRIFEEFRQAENTTAQKYGGTGLGLSISRHLARLLGGDLTVASAVGVGTTFTLIIPHTFVKP